MAPSSRPPVWYCCSPKKIRFCYRPRTHKRDDNAGRDSHIGSTTVDSEIQRYFGVAGTIKVSPSISIGIPVGPESALTNFPFFHRPEACRRHYSPLPRVESGLRELIADAKERLDLLERQKVCHNQSEMRIIDEKLRVSSSATRTGRRSPTSISRRSRDGERRRTFGASPPTSPSCRVAAGEGRRPIEGPATCFIVRFSLRSPRMLTGRLRSVWGMP